MSSSMNHHLLALRESLEAALAALDGAISAALARPTSPPPAAPPPTATEVVRRMRATSTAPRSNMTWLPADDARLRSSFENGEPDVTALAAQLGRTEKAILERARILGARERSTPAEGHASAHLRPQGAEQPRRKCRRWADSEDAYLRRFYPTTSTRVVGQALGRTPAAVIERARHLGIRKGLDEAAA